MPKFSINIGDCEKPHPILSPENTQKCFDGVFRAFQSLGTEAMREIEVVTVTPNGELMVRIIVVSRFGEGVQKLQADDYIALADGSDKITNSVVSTYWSLVEKAKERQKKQLAAIEGIPNIPAGICKKCRAPMLRTRPGGWSADSFSCPACFGTTPLESDWKLQPVTKEAAPATPTENEAPNQVPTPATNPDSCPECGHPLTRVGAFGKCGHCGHSISPS